MSDSNTLTAASTEATTSTRPPPAPRKGSRRREEVYKVLFVVPAFLAIIALFGYPVVKNLTMSFQEYTLRTFFTGKAPWVGLENYLTVVSDDVFSKALANTALFTIGSI
ncbi:MAG TPA: sugar ABC transporter permease, partial [Propionibacteriaceae bacterium]|nr:sugar ABC transporter permease [Propionibacteriaceae bacterium]